MLSDFASEHKCLSAFVGWLPGEGGGCLLQVGHGCGGGAQGARARVAQAAAGTVLGGKRAAASARRQARLAKSRAVRGKKSASSVSMERFYPHKCQDRRKNRPICGHFSMFTLWKTPTKPISCHELLSIWQRGGVLVEGGGRVLAAGRAAGRRRVACDRAGVQPALITRCGSLCLEPPAQSFFFMREQQVESS